MEKIVLVHFPDIKDGLLREAKKAFDALRDVDELRKKPSTSELIDWIRALMAGGISHEIIAKEVPLINALLKKEADYDYFANNYTVRPDSNLFIRRQ